MLGPTGTGWSVDMAAQKAQYLRSFSAWKSDSAEMNFMVSSRAYRFVDDTNLIHAACLLPLRRVAPN